MFYFILQDDAWSNQFVQSDKTLINPAKTLSRKIKFTFWNTIAIQCMPKTTFFGVVYVLMAKKIWSIINKALGCLSIYTSADLTMHTYIHMLISLLLSSEEKAQRRNNLKRWNFITTPVTNLYWSRTLLPQTVSSSSGREIHGHYRSPVGDPECTPQSRFTAISKYANPVSVTSVYASIVSAIELSRIISCCLHLFYLTGNVANIDSLNRKITNKWWITKAKFR